MQHKRLLGSLLLATVLAAGGARAGTTIEIEDPWVRATPPRAPNSAAFMVLRNTGSEPDRLVGAESPVAHRVEVHLSRMVDGMMRMRRVEGVDVPAGGTATLKPGGYHIMLMGVREQLRPGTRVPLTLIFERAGRVSVEAPVRAMPGMGMGHGGGMGTGREH